MFSIKSTPSFQDISVDSRCVLCCVAVLWARGRGRVGGPSPEDHREASGCVSVYRTWWRSEQSQPRRLCRQTRQRWYDNVSLHCLVKHPHNNLLRVSLYLMTPTQTWFRAPSLRGDTSDWDVKGAVCKIWSDIWFKTIKKQTNIMLKMSAEGTKWNWQLVCYKNDTEMWTLDKDGFRLLVSHWWHIKSQWLSSSNRKLVLKSSMNQAVNDEWGIKLEFVSVRAAEVFVVWGIYKDKGKKMLTNKHILKHPRWWLTVTQLLSSITSFLIFSQAN